jgi:hypothetical protein
VVIKLTVCVQTAMPVIGFHGTAPQESGRPVHGTLPFPPLRTTHDTNAVASALRSRKLGMGLPRYGIEPRQQGHKMDDLEDAVAFAIFTAHTAALQVCKRPPRHN